MFYRPKIPQCYGPSILVHYVHGIKWMVDNSDNQILTANQANRKDNLHDTYLDEMILTYEIAQQHITARLFRRCDKT